MAEVVRISAKDFFGDTFSTVKKNFFKLFGFAFLVGLVSSLLSGLAGEYVAISYLITLLVTTPLAMGLTWVYIKAVREKEYEFSDLLIAYKENYFQKILAYFLMSLIIGIGFLLFILPGIYFAIRLSIVINLLVDKNLEAVEAIKESWRITGGHEFLIFKLFLWAFLINLVGLLALIIGVFFTAVWTYLAQAKLYDTLVSLDNDSEGSMDTEEVVEEVKEEVEETAKDVKEAVDDTAEEVNEKKDEVIEKN